MRPGITNQKIRESVNLQLEFLADTGLTLRGRSRSLVKMALESCYFRGAQDGLETAEKVLSGISIGQSKSRPARSKP